MGSKWRHKYKKVKNSTFPYKPQLLTVENLVALNEIFKLHNWPVDMETPTSCFQRFRRTLSTLTPEEQCLILSLTERFKHFPKEEYSDLMIPLLY